MSSLGQLVIELAANTARLQSDMGKAVGIVERSAAKFKNAFKFVGGGLLGAAIASTVKQSIQFGDEIQKAATKAGVGAKQMSELAYAAKLADVDIGSLSTALKKMQVSLSEAGTGAKGPNEALAALGLTIQQVQKRKPEAQFELLADRISKLTDPADRARAAVELFGKAGADLLPLFAEGAAGIAKARAEAEKLGLSFSGEQIKKLADADDSIKRLDASWKGFATTLTAFVAPALSAVFDRLSGLDTRGLDTKIADLEDNLSRKIRNRPQAERDRLQKELDQLRAQREMAAVRDASTGTRGGPTGRGPDGLAIGFAAADAATKASEAAEKARAEDLKFQEKWAKDSAEINRKLNEDFGEELDQKLAEDRAKYIDYYLELDEQRKKDLESLERWRAEQSAKLSDNAQVFKDAFLNAFDDMVNTGKFKWDELLKYMIAEFARRGIVKLFDKIFTPGGGIGGGVAGFLKGIGSIFGGGRANGGSVQAGKFYEVGERGPELFAPGRSGSIIPHGATGGNVINLSMPIDARGSSIESVKLLERAVPRIVDMAVAKMTEGLNRRSLGVR